MSDLLKEVYDSKLNKSGQLVVNKIKLLLQATVGRPTKLTESLYHKVENGELKIYSSTPIITFLDKGTDPYVIKAKPGSALAFKAMGSFTGKTGKKYQDGDDVVVKEVKHPGIEGRAFVEAALFASKKDIIKSLSSSTSKAPTLAFVSEDDKLYRLH